jgi:hypothetical protein
MLDEPQKENGYPPSLLTGYTGSRFACPTQAGCFQSRRIASTPAMTASYRCSVAPGLCWHRRVGRLKPATCVDRAYRICIEEVPDAASIAAPQFPQRDRFRAARSGLASHDRTCDHHRLANLLTGEIRVRAVFKGALRIRPGVPLNRHSQVLSGRISFLPWPPMRLVLFSSF